MVFAGGGGVGVQGVPALVGLVGVVGVGGAGGVGCVLCWGVVGEGAAAALCSLVSSELLVCMPSPVVALGSG